MGAETRRQLQKALYDDKHCLQLLKNHYNCLWKPHFMDTYVYQFLQTGYGLFLLVMFGGLLERAKERSFANVQQTFLVNNEPVRNWLSL